MAAGGVTLDGVGCRVKFVCCHVKKGSKTLRLCQCCDEEIVFHTVSLNASNSGIVAPA